MDPRIVEPGFESMSPAEPNDVESNPGEGEQEVVNRGSVLSNDVTRKALLEGLSPREIDVRAGHLLAFSPETESVEDADLFDFEVTDELRQLASGYETLGDTISNGWLPSSLVADLLFPEEASDDSQ